MCHRKRCPPHFLRRILPPGAWSSFWNLASWVTPSPLSLFKLCSPLAPSVLPTEALRLLHLVSRKQGSQWDWEEANHSQKPAEWQNWEMGKRKQEPEEWSQVRADWRNNTEAKGDASFQRNMTWWRRKCGSGIESWLLHFLAAWSSLKQWCY